MMKQAYTTVIALLIGITGYTQTLNSNVIPKKKGEPAKENRKSEIKGVSPSTAIFMLKMTDEKFSRQIAGSDSLRKHYGIKQVNGTDYVNAFLIASSEADLDQYGFIEGNTKEEITTGLIPVEQLHSLSADEEVTYVQKSEKAELKLDNTLATTGVNEVHQGAGSLSQAYFGEGVVVGVIDGGFDYTHPTFYDSTYSTYRVKRVWEQNATSGTPPAGYSYGRELTNQTSILNAQRDRIELSHGTHVAGTAAGSGAGTSGKYKGVAFKSDIVLVSTSEQNTDISDGIEYIYNYANSVGKPCVINMSLGKHLGPHDGTSFFDQFCDDAVGKGKILVGAAGNEGSTPLYIEKSYTSLDTAMVSFVEFPKTTEGTNGSTEIDIWGNPNQNFYVSVNVFNTNTNSYEDWTPFIAANSGNTYNYTLQDGDSFFPDDCNVDLSTEINPLNSKPHMNIQIDHTDQDDDYRWVMIEVIAYNTQTKMWATNKKARFTSNGYNSPLVDGSTSSTVCEIGGTGNSIITVGAYTSKNTYTNHSNSTVDFSAQAPLGEIAPFSSHGPTADNRTKPDITAPGNVIVAPVSSFDNGYASTSPQTVYSVTDGTNNWYYGAMQGTSMASPVVTGVVALLLEAYPDLDPTQALTLLRDNADTDGFTGTIPNNGDNTWGWGKVNARFGMIDLESNIPAKPAISPAGNISLCQGESETLSAPSGFSSYEWNTSATTQSITVNSSGNYSVRVENNKGYIGPWSDPKNVDVNPNPNTPTINTNGNTLTSSSAASYQWYFNGNIISGATQQTHTAQNTGDYHVEVANNSNCTAVSNSVNVTVTSDGLKDSQASKVAVYPNPNNGRFTVHSSLKQPISIDIVDATGRLISSVPNISNGKSDIEIGNVSSGIYFIRFKVDKEVETQKLLIK